MEEPANSAEEMGDDQPQEGPPGAGVSSQNDGDNEADYQAEVIEGVEVIDGYPVNHDDGLYPQVLEGDYREEDSMSGGNEGDEAINLTDILSARDSCLTEEELWALCRECCLVLEVVNSSPEMFQTLCITPDTVAFDNVGNVCFLDLGSGQGLRNGTLFQALTKLARKLRALRCDIYRGSPIFRDISLTDPEQLYLPPEYNNEDGNGYKSHLFSLGMTLLYAAEYNCAESGQVELSPELHDLFGCMTSENVKTRPDLESVITQCEEELTGKSSQDICAAIGQFVPLNTPGVDLSTVSLADVTESLAEYLQTQSSLIAETDSRPSVHSKLDLPDPQEHSTPLLPHHQSLRQETDTVNPGCSDMPARGLHTGIPQPTGNRGRPSPHRTSRGGSANSNSQEPNNNVSKELNKIRPPLPKKPDSFRKENVKKPEDDSGFMADTGNFSEMDTPDKQNRIQVLDTSLERQQQVSPSATSVSSAMEGRESVGTAEYKSKRSKRRQGITISEALDVMDRYFGEEELWALMKEGISALRRKRKHLPAYLCPDTLLLRENGSLSFKAIPEDKPLETMFMSPELQQKGELSEKACLYGLGISMRCAGGNKYSKSMDELNMSGDLIDLLTSMVDPDPKNRPSVDEVSELCGEQERDMGMSFSNTNQLLFQEAYIKLLDHQMPEIPKEPPPHSPKGDQSSAGESSAFRPINGSKPSTGAGVGSSAFKPVPVKREKNKDSAYPSAFSSTATHFRPIVLHQSESPEKQNKQADSSSQQDSAANDKDKEVVRKLKELKKNLMKHRQTEKIVENENKADHAKSPQDCHQKTSVPTSKLKPAKSTDNLHDKSSSDTKSEPGGALESLLSEIQKQGAVPDTNSLASAIAGYLQSHLSQSDSKSLGGSGANVISADVSQGHQGQFNSMQGQGHGFSPQNPTMQNVASQLPNLNIPVQYHQQLLGQTMTLPLSQQHYSGGLIPGYPMQVQLQQDPRTGFIQLVPVGLMGPPVNSQGNINDDLNNSDSRSVHSSKSPKPSSADNSAILNSSFNSNKSRGRTARDLVQRTANIRNRNNIGEKTVGASVQNNDSSLWRSKSAYALDHGDKSNPSQQMSVKGQVYDDSAIQMNRGNGGVYNLHPPKHYKEKGEVIDMAQTASQYYTQPPRTRSQSSSPSPSKDSGVSGMNTGYKPPPPGSLMERLLNSNVSMKQQQRLGNVVHLLREEFAFDGYMENGVEDLAMAEYISALGNLKWETFASAIKEKYSDLYWSSNLLCSLYEAVNGIKPDICYPTHKNRKVKEADNVSMRTEDMEVKLPGLDDQNLSSSSMSDKSGRQSGNQTHKRVHGDASGPGSSRAVGRAASGQGGYPGSDKQLDSSDSDRDEYERKRRYRRRHQGDRMARGSTSGYGPSSNTNDSYRVSPVDNRTRSLEIPPRIHQVQINGDRLPIQDGGVIRGNDIRDSWEGDSLPQMSHFHDPNSVNVNEASSTHQSMASTLPLHRGQRQNAWGDSSSVGDIAQASNAMSLDRNLQQRKRESPSAVRQVSLSNLMPEAHPRNSQNRFTPEKPPRHSGGSLVNRNSDSNISHAQLRNTSPSQKPALLTRAGSSSSHSSSVGGTPMTRHLSQLSLTDQVILRTEATGIPKRRCHVLYHGAMIQLNITPDIERFMQDIDEENPDSLRAQLASLEQQLMMERKMRRKSQNFYNKLQDTPRSSKGDQKNTATQVSKDLTEMTQKVRFLELCRSHIEMLQAELHGIHCSYLFSIATCSRGQPLHLKPCQENSLLQFQVFREPHSGCDLQQIQAGTADGLMSYLFAYTALSDGFVHQFLFCFRYFVKAIDVLSFLINIYKSAGQRHSSGDLNLPRIQTRVLDILHFWLEGFYSVDFEGNPEVIELLHAFLHLNEIKSLREGQELLDLLTSCEDGHSVDLISVKAEEDVHIYKAAAPKKEPILKLEKIADEWGSLKSIFKGKSASPKPLTVCGGDRSGPMKANHDEVYFPKTSRRTDSFALADYTPQCLAEQLTLIAQSVFHLTHPVHYLNSKAQGVSVALTMSGNRMPSLLKQANTEESSSLFVDGDVGECAVQMFIDHMQEVAHWTAAEIVGCSSSKGQVAVLSKFLYTAQICKEMRNYGTCLAVLDGLENLIVKQLPAWKHLPTKCVAIIEELTAVRVFLKNDDMSLLSTPDSHLLPTIPSVLLFLLHVQQQEIGSFQLANGMYKWSKMRSIWKVIDQIRIFKDHVYGFDPDLDLQETLQQRINEFSGQDIHAIASQHDTNFQKISSSGGIGAAFRKMKGRLQSK